MNKPSLSFMYFSVQLCWEASGPQGQLDEAPAGGDDDQDGRAGKGVHEEQAAGQDCKTY